MENIGIKICPDKEVVVATVDGILQIFNAKVDNETMRAALAVLGRTASADYATISNVSISMGEFKPSSTEEAKNEET